MSKVAKKAVYRTTLSLKSIFNTEIKARSATAAPPLGPLLGKFGLNISNFCKEFNEKTKNYKKGIPLPVTVRIKPNRTYDINLHTPPIKFYVMQAAGIDKEKQKEETKTGEITMKHIYEIAKIKYEDPYSKYQVQELEDVVEEVIREADSLGLEIVDAIDPVQYKEFLEKRKELLQKLAEEYKMKLKLPKVVSG